MARGRPRHLDLLTPAEWRVLERIREGRSYAEAAADLGLSLNTVKYHVANMLTKLNLSSRAELEPRAGEGRGRRGWFVWLAIGGASATGVIAVVVALAFRPGERPSRPPAQAIYFSSAASPGIRSVSVADGERIVSGEGFRALAPAVSPDGTALAFISLPADVPPSSSADGPFGDLVSIAVAGGDERILDSRATFAPLGGVIAGPH